MAFNHGNGVPRKALKITIKGGMITLTATEAALTFTLENWNLLMQEIGAMK